MFYSKKEWGRKVNKDDKQQRDLTGLSKTLARTLRHKAEEMELNIQPNGYVKISELLKTLPNSNKKEIIQVVEHNQTHSKARFSISDDGIYIRANQGHTMKCIKPELFMTLIDDPSKFVPRNKETGKFECLHGTSQQRLGGNIKLIKDIKKEKDEKVGEEFTGLSKMSRQHVHFAKGMIGEDGVKSGMRATSDIYIFCDMVEAMKAGLLFYESSNGVILTEGNKNGIVPSKFLRVEYRD